MDVSFVAITCAPHLLLPLLSPLPLLQPPSIQSA